MTVFVSAHPTVCLVNNPTGSGSMPYRKALRFPGLLPLVIGLGGLSICCLSKTNKRLKFHCRSVTVTRLVNTPLVNTVWDWAVYKVGVSICTMIAGRTQKKTGRQKQTRERKEPFNSLVFTAVKKTLQIHIPKYTY